MLQADHCTWPEPPAQTCKGARQTCEHRHWQMALQDLSVATNVDSIDQAVPFRRGPAIQKRCRRNHFCTVLEGMEWPRQVPGRCCEPPLWWPAHRNRKILTQMGQGPLPANADAHLPQWWVLWCPHWPGDRLPSASKTLHQRKLEEGPIATEVPHIDMGLRIGPPRYHKSSHHVPVLPWNIGCTQPWGISLLGSESNGSDPCSCHWKWWSSQTHQPPLGDFWFRFWFHVPCAVLIIFLVLSPSPQRPNPQPGRLPAVPMVVHD